MKHIWRNYNLSIVLATLFLVSWVGQFGAGWVHFSSEQSQKGQPASIFGADGYIWRFSENTLENWQSEFLQLLTFVVLTAYLIHRGSHESKDTDDEMMERMKRIESRLEQLAKSRDLARTPN